jgi:hypothetical protein
MNFQDKIAVSHIKNALSNLDGPTKFSKENYNIVSHKQRLSHVETDNKNWNLVLHSFLIT